MAAFADNRLPAHGLDADAVLARLDELAADDRDWRGGRVFSLVYSAGDDVLDLLTRAANRFSARERPEHHGVPEPRVDAARHRHHHRRPARCRPAPAGQPARSGATSPRAAPSRSSRPPRPPATGAGPRGGPTRPNMVLATSAHAAFEKAAHYFDVEARRVAGAGRTGAPTSTPLPIAVDDDTVLVVGSAPSYPQGVIDPIPELAALALERRRPLPRRRLPRRLPPPLPRHPRPRHEAVGPVGARRDLDQRRPPQVRVRVQGGVGHRLRRRRARPPPAVRHLELARRPLRLAVHGGHPAGRPDRRRLGRPPPPRRGRLPPPGRGRLAGRRPRSGPPSTTTPGIAAAGRPGRHRAGLRRRRVGRGRHLRPGRRPGRARRLVLRPPDAPGQPPRHGARRPPGRRRRALRRPGRRRPPSWPARATGPTTAPPGTARSDGDPAAPGRPRPGADTCSVAAPGPIVYTCRTGTGRRPAPWRGHAVGGPT